MSAQPLGDSTGVAESDATVILRECKVPVMTHRAATLVSAFILAVALLVRCVLVIAVPKGPTVARGLEGMNDEPAHFNYVRHLVVHRSLPVQTRHVREPGAFVRGDFEYYQPPLYYLVCAPLLAIAGESLGFLACRWVSFACGVLSLLVLARILARLACPPSSVSLGVAFLALMPTHAYFSALVSNDSMSWLIALLIVYEVLGLLESARGGAAGFDPRRDAWIGVLLAAGLLTKSTVAVVIPVVMFAYVYRAWRTRDLRGLAGLAIALGVAATLSAPWYTRNIARYGAPLPLHIGFGPVEAGRSTLESLYHVAGSTIRYFWFPMAHIGPGTSALVVRSVGGVLMLIHAALALAYTVRAGGRNARVLSLWLLLAVTLAGYVKLNLLWGEAEARFLFPALAAIVFLFVQPVFALCARWKSGEAIAWAWICLLAIHPWVLLAFA
jgi:4-amino-4-deoxy-L-arabinose transferase-like glycosyltransferase